MLMHLLRFISQKGLSSAFGRESEVWFVESDVFSVFFFQMHEISKWKKHFKRNNEPVVGCLGDFSAWNLSPLQKTHKFRHEENQSLNRDSVGVFGSFADESDPTLSCQAFHVEGWLLTRDFLLATVCVCFQDVAWVCIPPSQHCQFSPKDHLNHRFLFLFPIKFIITSRYWDSVTVFCFCRPKSSETVKNPPKNHRFEVMILFHKSR